MDKNMFRIEHFYFDEFPDWRCPSCGLGKLENKSIGTKDEKSLKLIETKKSLSDRDNIYWEPEWIRFKVYGYLICSYCNEYCLLSGDAEYYDFSDIESNAFSILVSSFYFNPALNIIEINKDCPKEIQTLIRESFKLYWFIYQVALIN